MPLSAEGWNVVFVLSADCPRKKSNLTDFYVGSDHLVLCQELEKRNETIPGFSRWCLKSEEVCCVLLKDVVGSALAIYQRTEAKDASRDVAILLG